MRVECCQCGNDASSNVASFQLGIGIGYWQHFHIGNINLIGAPGRSRDVASLRSALASSSQYSAACVSKELNRPLHWLLVVGCWLLKHFGRRPIPEESEKMGDLPKTQVAAARHTCRNRQKNLVRKSAYIPLAYRERRRGPRQNETERDGAL